MVFEINLLPEKYRKKGFKIQFDARVLGVLGGIAALALMGWVTIQQGRRITELEDQRDELTAQKTLLEPRANEVDRLTRELQTLNENIATLQALGGRNTVQVQILDLVSTRVPDGLWLLDLNQTAQQQQGQQIPGNRVLNLRGHALRKEIVADFISRLQAEDLIQQVQTNFMRPARVAGQDVFEYSLTAVLNTAG